MNLNDISKATDRELFELSNDIYLGPRFMREYLETKEYVKVCGKGNDPSILSKAHPRFYPPNKEWDDFATNYQDPKARKQRKRAFHGLGNARKGEKPKPVINSALFDAASYSEYPDSKYLGDAYYTIGKEMAPILLSGDKEKLSEILSFTERLKTEGFMAISAPMDAPLSDGKLKTRVLFNFLDLCLKKSRLPTDNELWMATPSSKAGKHRKKYDEALEALGIVLRR